MLSRVRLASALGGATSADEPMVDGTILTLARNQEDLEYWNQLIVVGGPMSRIKVSPGFSADRRGHMVDGSEKYRSFFAKLICAAAKLDDPRIEEAFRSVKREPFAGPGPWWLNLDGHAYVQTPDDDPAFLYQDLLLALDREREIKSENPAPTPSGWEPARSRRPRR